MCCNGNFPVKKAPRKPTSLVICSKKASREQRGAGREVAGTGEAHPTSSVGVGGLRATTPEGSAQHYITAGLL